MRFKVRRSGLHLELIHVDARDIPLDDESIDAICCDPPYGLEFMGKDWDQSVPGKLFWDEAYRVAKPGCFMLAFGGTRTHHRLMCAIEDAGWEIRDVIMWLYGSGFPKSFNISKGIDKKAGVKREVIGYDQSRVRPNRKYRSGAIGNIGGVCSRKVSDRTDNGATITAPATDQAKLWDGYGTALKPAWEPIILAMKPLDKNFAYNAVVHGCGGLNIDGCRIGTDQRYNNPASPSSVHGKGSGSEGGYVQGRWPANVILDEEAGKMVDEQTGGVSRFFYCPKASRKERGEGNKHPTVKPVSLLRYLIRLITPPNGLVLDQFIGSGSTMVAAVEEEINCIGMDINKKYLNIAKNRVIASCEENAVDIDGVLYREPKKKFRVIK